MFGGWPQRARVLIGGLVLLALCAGCDQHELTRTPEGSTATYHWTLVWTATVLLAGVLAVPIVRRYQRQPGWRRSVGGGVFIALGVIALMAIVTLQVIGPIRTHQLVDKFGGCYDVPFAQRAPSMLQLTCGESVDVDLGVFGVVLLLVLFVIYLALAIVPILIGRLALSADRSLLWLPGALAAVVGVFGLMTFAHEPTAASFFIGAGAFVSSGCLLDEWVTWFRSRPNLRSLPPPTGNAL